MEKERLKPGRKELPKELKRKIVTAYLTDSEKEIIKSKWGNLTSAVKHLLSLN
jgi:hypothetical protein